MHIKRGRENTHVCIYMGYQLVPPGKKSENIWCLKKKKKKKLKNYLTIIREQMQKVCPVYIQATDAL